MTKQRREMVKGVGAGLAVLAVLYILATTFGIRRVLVTGVQGSEPLLKAIEVSSPDTKIHSSGKITVGRHRSTGSNVQVKCKLPDGSEHPLRIDSGFGSAHLSVTANLAERIGLAMKSSGRLGPSLTGGACSMPMLEIGDMLISNPSCTYRDQYWERRFFGMKIDEQTDIAMGLELMVLFKYILFDNSAREVTFCTDEPFDPYFGKWKKYPLALRKDSYRQLRLMVDMPIGNDMVHIMFDTCGGTGMKNKASTWRKISQGLDAPQPKKGKMLTGQFGWLDCQTVIMPQLKVGSRTVSNAVVMIRPDEEEYIGDVLSMDYFNDTTVVLDFESWLLWVRTD